MGKIRIVKQFNCYRVEEEVTRTHMNETYKSWEIVENKQPKSFKTEEEAEEYATSYINKKIEARPEVVKEYEY